MTVSQWFKTAYLGFIKYQDIESNIWRFFPFKLLIAVGKRSFYILRIAKCEFVISHQPFSVNFSQIWVNLSKFAIFSPFKKENFLFFILGKVQLEIRKADSIPYKEKNHITFQGGRKGEKDAHDISSYLPFLSKFTIILKNSLLNFLSKCSFILQNEVNISGLAFFLVHLGCLVREFFQSALILTVTKLKNVIG